ncbi:hypothetical protein, partial [Pseudarthrobacter sp. DSP2-3-2b1]|uniref:hypothetical protein n=1 Tax=Pseudarthrobacter sp. DSP2-3-2b1 TaxID=2804661 RepID=UPI003CEEA40E
QTTDTPGTTTTSQPWIAPEQLFKLTRIPAPMQIPIPGPTPARNPNPHHIQALKRATKKMVLN